MDHEAIAYPSTGPLPPAVRQSEGFKTKSADTVKNGVLKTRLIGRLIVLFPSLSYSYWSKLLQYMLSNF